MPDSGRCHAFREKINFKSLHRGCDQQVSVDKRAKAFYNLSHSSKAILNNAVKRKVEESFDVKRAACMLRRPSQTLFERHLGALPLNLLNCVEGSD